MSLYGRCVGVCVVGVALAWEALSSVSLVPRGGGGSPAGWSPDASQSSFPPGSHNREKKGMEISGILTLSLCTHCDPDQLCIIILNCDG